MKQIEIARIALQAEVLQNGLRKKAIRIIQTVASFFPLTQGVNLLQAVSLGKNVTEMIVPLLVLPIVAVVCSVISIRVFRYTK